MKIGSVVDAGQRLLTLFLSNAVQHQPIGRFFKFFTKDYKLSVFLCTLKPAFEIFSTDRPVPRTQHNTCCANCLVLVYRTLCLGAVADAQISILMSKSNHEDAQISISMSEHELPRLARFTNPGPRDIQVRKCVCPSF